MPATAALHRDDDGLDDAVITDLSGATELERTNLAHLADRGAYRFRVGAELSRRNHRAIMALHACFEQGQRRTVRIQLVSVIAIAVVVVAASGGHVDKLLEIAGKLIRVIFL